MFSFKFRCVRLIRMKLFFTRVKVKYLLFGVLVVAIADVFGLFSHVLETHYEHFSYPLDINTLDILDSLKIGKKPDVSPINLYNYSFLIANDVKCKTLDEREYDDVTLLILVKSAMNNFKQRDAIRNSWGFEKRFSDVKIRRVFLVGTDPYTEDSERKINLENKKYRDLVQADFVDAYYNNTIKTMMGFKWAVIHCPKTQFVFLVDDDMYVSVKNLLKFLRNPLNVQLGPSRQLKSAAVIRSSSLEELEKLNDDFDEDLDNRNNYFDNRRKFYDGRLYGGYLFPDSSPMRHKTSKWYISLTEYPFHKYPPYISAGAVAFSFPALSDMYHISLYTKHFKFDDIYMGILALKSEIIPIHNENFHFWGKSYSKKGYEDVIIAHGYNNPQMLYKTWEEQRSSGHA